MQEIQDIGEHLLPGQIGVNCANTVCVIHLHIVKFDEF